MFPVRRGAHDDEAFISAFKILERGGAIGMYCEGGRSRTGEVGTEARPGIGRLALESGAPVVPVAILGSHQVRNWKRLQFPKVTVSYGTPLRFTVIESPTREQQQEAADVILDRIRTQHTELVRLGHRGARRAARAARPRDASPPACSRRSAWPSPGPAGPPRRRAPSCRPSGRWWTSSPPRCSPTRTRAAAWARDRAPLHALLYDADAGFGAGGADALRATLEQAWRAIRAVATGALIEAGAPGRLLMVAPRPDAGRHAPAARAALENLARTLSVEWARYGITAVALWPGPEHHRRGAGASSPAFSSRRPAGTSAAAGSSSAARRSPPADRSRRAHTVFLRRSHAVAMARPDAPRHDQARRTSG